MRKVIGAGLCALGLIFGFQGKASAVLVINEVLNNIPGGGDNGNEYVEIKGSASESLTNVWFIQIDDDGATNGVIRNAVDLGALSATVGTNGFLLVEDAAAVSWTPAPAGATTRVVSNFTPDLDNNACTFALVTSFTGVAGTTDLDVNNDGTIDVALPWTTTLDAIGVQNSGGTNTFMHADDLGGTTIPFQTFTPDVIWRATQTSQWEGADALGTNQSANYTMDPTNVTNAMFANQVLSPGSDNSTTLDVEISESSVD